MIQFRQNPHTLLRSLAWAPLATFQEVDKDDIFGPSFASYIIEDCLIPPAQLRVKHLLTSSQLECRQSGCTLFLNTKRPLAPKKSKNL